MQRGRRRSVSRGFEEGVWEGGCGGERDSRERGWRPEGGGRVDVDPEEAVEEGVVVDEGGETAAGGDHVGEGGEVEGGGWVGAVEVLGGGVSIHTYIPLEIRPYIWVCVYVDSIHTSKLAIVATAPTNSSEK